MDTLRGRVVWVTGGSRGIGAAIVAGLAAAGAQVVLSGRDAAAATATADRWRAVAQEAGGEVVGLAADVRDPAALRAVVATTHDRFGRLDGLVANAGVGRMAPIDALADEDWRDVIDTNLGGVFHTIRAAVASLIASGGTIVTVGSLAGVHAFAGGAAYNASKFGLLGLTEAVMHDLRDRGVRVATVLPGSVATGFSRRSAPDDTVGRLRPEDVAEAVLWILANPSRALPSRIELRPARRRPGSA